MRWRPYTVVDEGRHHRLRRYFGGEDKADRPAVVLVPPLMVVADIYDVAPAVSAVAILHAHGTDPWVVDFGAPEREPGGLERGIADHVLAVSEAVDRVHDITGRAVHLAGYSQGGIISYETAAYRRGKDIASVITFGSPADTSMPFGLPQHVVAPVAQLAVRLSGEPAVRDFVEDLFAHNRVLEGGLAIGSQMVSLAEIDCPVLAFVGEQDTIAVPPSVRAIRRAGPKAEAYEVALHAGHMGLVVSSLASHATWPTVAAWAMWRESRGSRPRLVTAK
jgi:putative long chain acyl-CoA synthase